jgi:hypothetical protein
MFEEGFVRKAGAPGANSRVENVHRIIKEYGRSPLMYYEVQRIRRCFAVFDTHNKLGPHSEKSEGVRLMICFLGQCGDEQFAIDTRGSRTYLVEECSFPS